MANVYIDANTQQIVSKDEYSELAEKARLYDELQAAKKAAATRTTARATAAKPKPSAATTPRSNRGAS